MRIIWYRKFTRTFKNVGEETPHTEQNKSRWNRIKNKNEEHTSNQEQTIKTWKQIKGKPISSPACKRKTEN